jgi:DNA integrity scanning protein DisA with diadenylate cyclase activity
MRDERSKKTGTGSNKSDYVQIVCLNGSIHEILGTLRGRGKKNLNIIERTLEIITGLSLKGYEGKAVGTMFLIGDIEGVKKNTTPMIINPFKGWRDVNIMDGKRQRTFEAFSQLDGAIVIDSRGNAHSAGRMVHVKDDPTCGKEFSVQKPWDSGGTGTRSRASKYITEVSKTVAITLSMNGDISIYHGGKEIGSLKRDICMVRTDSTDIIIR